jgi:hypothetical protein
LNNHATLYRIELVIDGGISHEVLNVLNYLLAKPRARMSMDIAPPNHPFFATPGWMGVFNRATGSLRRVRATNCLVLRVCGENALEEQDIGLFLRWLQPHILNKGVRPRRLAVVRNKARVQTSSLSYFISNGKIDVCYVDQPLFSINNFHAKRAA